jgi:ankyrin repeat protein
MHFAAQVGDVAIFNLLAKAPGSQELLEAVNDEERSCLHAAAEKGHQELGRVMIETNGRLMEILDYRQKRAIHLAASNGHAGFVEMLLSVGAPVDARDERKWTALDVAAQRGHLNVVEVLLQHGAPVDAMDINNVSGNGQRAPGSPGQG